MAIQNNGGCDALNQRVSYTDRKKDKESVQHAGKPWWSGGKANLILVPIFSAMDGMVLYSIFDECLTQSVLMGIIMAFGVAVVLNILPLVIAYFVHIALDKRGKHPVLMMSIFIAGFIFIYLGTVILRFSYSDMYGQDYQSVQLDNAVANEQPDNELNKSETTNSKGLAVVLLLSISPLITSILGFGIAFVGDDPTRKEIETLETKIVEVEEKICDTESAIVQLEAVISEGIDKEIELDESAMLVAIDEVLARGDVLKALARQYLAEYCENPSAISKLSQEMRVKVDDNAGEQESESQEAVENEEGGDVFLIA